jgi:hypothetical protein
VLQRPSGFCESKEDLAAHILITEVQFLFSQRIKEGQKGKREEGAKNNFKGAPVKLPYNLITPFLGIDNTQEK